LENVQRGDLPQSGKRVQKLQRLKPFRISARLIKKAIFSPAPVPELGAQRGCFFAERCGTMILQDISYSFFTFLKPKQFLPKEVFHMMIWIWLGAIVLFGLVEAATAGLVSIWFVAGAVAALVATILNVSVGLQFAIFLAVSSVALAATRPLVQKMKSGKTIPTNLDRVIGLTGKVTETVDNENATGAVYVDGKTWSARSADGTVLPEGSLVTISKMEGVKLFVEKNEILEGTR